MDSVFGLRLEIQELKYETSKQKMRKIQVCLAENEGVTLADGNFVDADTSILVVLHEGEWCLCPS